MLCFPVHRTYKFQLSPFYSGIKFFNHLRESLGVLEYRHFKKKKFLLLRGVFIVGINTLVLLSSRLHYLFFVMDHIVFMWKQAIVVVIACLSNKIQLPFFTNNSLEISLIPMKFVFGSEWSYLYYYQLILMYSTVTNL